MADIAMNAPLHGQPRCIQPQNSAIFQNSAEFNGFHKNRSNQSNANVTDGGIRTESGFNGFSTNASNFHSARNEPDNWGVQPEAVASATKNDILQHKYGITQKKPKYKQYAVKARRLSTFRNFPPEITQSKDELAEAGFFFSGKDDVVYCYFCGQGLRAWEPEDDVWVEHARWSPECVHLLNCKGREFVQMVKLADTNPEISVPSTQNSCDKVEISSNEASGSSIRKEVDATRTLENSNSPLMQTVAAQSIIMNGYDRDAVLKAINVFKVKGNGRTDFNATDLLKIIFDLEENSIDYDQLVAGFVANNEVKSNPELQPQTAEQSVKKNESYDMSECDQREAKTLLAENKQLKDQTICKICLEETVSVVFLPCGHLCSCSQCAPALRKCPICRGFIKGTVKTFLT